MRERQMRADAGAWARGLWGVVALMVTATCAPGDEVPAGDERFIVPTGARTSERALQYEGLSRVAGARFTDAPGFEVVGGARLRPEGERFSQPIAVRIDLDRQLEPGTAVIGGVWDGAIRGWRRDRTSSGDVAQGLVLGDGRHALVVTSHFSDHVIGALSDAARMGDDPVDGLAPGGVQIYCPLGSPTPRWQRGLVPSPAPEYSFALGLHAGLVRRQAFASVFGDILLHELGEREGQRLVDDWLGAGDTALTSMEVILETNADTPTLLRPLRSAWGVGRSVLGSGTPRDAFRSTTFRNTVAAYGRFLAGLEGLNLALMVEAGVVKDLVRVSFVSGVARARAEWYRAALDRAGLFRDSAIRDGFDDAVASLDAALLAQQGELISFIRSAASSGALTITRGAAEGGVWRYLTGRLGSARGAIVAAVVIEYGAVFASEATAAAKICSLTTIWHYVGESGGTERTRDAARETWLASYGGIRRLQLDWLDNTSGDIRELTYGTIINLFTDRSNAFRDFRAHVATEHTWAVTELARLMADGALPCGGEHEACCLGPIFCNAGYVCARSGFCTAHEAPFSLFAGAPVAPRGDGCTPSATRPCEGTGCSGTQRCDGNRTWGACVCDTIIAPDASADAPPPDASVMDIPVSCTGAHRMVCGSACVDSWTDDANCGRCTNRCATGQHCDLGSCVADTPACSGAHVMRCGSVCVDTWTDRTNCGRCGAVCPSGQRCSLGACVPIDPCATMTCPECQTCRSGTCAPLLDLTSCSAGRECYGGACVARCATNYCQTYRYDSGAWCDGNSIVGCAPSGRCRVEASRVACPTTCVAGRCTACPTNLADCDGVASNGCEADLRTSATNCGTCRLVCAAGVACHGGICDGSAARLALGNSHSCALTTLGTAQCWGENIAGELGNGAVFPLRNELTPVGVVDLTNAIDLAAARSSTCAIRTGGAVVCWGHNDRGQLGTGSTGPWTSHFVSTVGITNARQITAGWDHVCVATTADTVSCWGLNLDGRLGDGTTTDRAGPVAVTGLSNVAQVDAGPMHTCSVRRDGTVSCWGFGSTGRLGTGTYDDQYRPAAVTGISNATAVSCSRYATCVLRVDATVACTGGNDNGELGDGTMTRRPTMAPVPGLSDVVRLAMGDTHACVIRRDGSVWCWGRNGGGQLGDGTTTTRLVPTRVPGVTGALQVDAGAAHTCALLTGGRIVCWGTNAAGQLGDGTTTSRSAPVSVALR